MGALALGLMLGSCVGLIATPIVLVAGSLMLMMTLGTAMLTGDSLGAASWWLAVGVVFAYNAGIMASLALRRDGTPAAR
jgi:hypothetical protein